MVKQFPTLIHLRHAKTFFDGIAHWTLYWSTTSSFEAADPIDGLASNYNSACLLRLNVCNDLAKAMKALDGKKASCEDLFV